MNGSLISYDDRYLSFTGEQTNHSYLLAARFDVDFWQLFFDDLIEANKQTAGTRISIINLANEICLLLIECAPFVFLFSKAAS